MDMTGLILLLGVLLLTTGGLGVMAQRRYQRLLRNYKALQQNYEKAEQQLHSLWGGKRP
ncbi:MAG: hypothetical protein NVS3B25_30720 [Hymenobacter sp.]